MPETPAPPPQRQQTLGNLTLAYRSLRPVGEAAYRQLESAARALDDLHDWWAEGIQLVRQADGHLEGTTRLSLVGYENAAGEPVEIEDDQDAFMAWMDLTVIIDWLAEQALDVALSYGPEAVGRILGGEPDEALDAFVAALGEAVGAAFDDIDAEMAEAVSEAHRDRLACSQD